MEIFRKPAMLQFLGLLLLLTFMTPSLPASGTSKLADCLIVELPPRYSFQMSQSFYEVVIQSKCNQEDSLKLNGTAIYLFLSQFRSTPSIVSFYEYSAQGQIIKFMIPSSSLYQLIGVHTPNLTWFSRVDRSNVELLLPPINYPLPTSCITAKKLKHKIIGKMGRLKKNLVTVDVQINYTCNSLPYMSLSDFEFKLRFDGRSLNDETVSYLSRKFNNVNEAIFKFSFPDVAPNIYTPYLVYKFVPFDHYGKNSEQSLSFVNFFTSINCVQEKKKRKVTDFYPKCPPGFRKVS